MGYKGENQKTKTQKRMGEKKWEKGVGRGNLGKMKGVGYWTKATGGFFLLHMIPLSFQWVNVSVLS